MHLSYCDTVAVAVALCVISSLAPVLAAQSPQPDTASVEITPRQQPPSTEPSLVVLSGEQLADAERWAREFDEWQQWAALWLNRRQPGAWAYALERNKKPDPPTWLADACELLPDDQLDRPCRLLADWRDDVITTRNRQASAMALAQREAPTKSAWWRHAHLDTLWSSAQSNTAALGLIGAHLTMEVQGRLQVFITPGIMLVSVPLVPGSRELVPATDWGVTYRLFNIGSSTVHFNLVHAWLLANPTASLSSQVSLAGLSFSFRPHPAAP